MFGLDMPAAGELVARYREAVELVDRLLRNDSPARNNAIRLTLQGTKSNRDGIGTLVDERSRGEERMRRFLADASHELRTPVAAVQGYADLYRAGALTENAAVDRAMERMGFEARRMGALVDDLLTLVKADSPQGGMREPVDLADLLTGVVDDAAVIDRTRIWRLAGTGAVIGCACTSCSRTCSPTSGPTPRRGRPRR